MKRSTVLFLTLIISNALSQNSAVTNASLYREEGNLAEAKKEIDKAVIHEKTSIEPKAWYHRGMVYSDIFASKDPAVRMLSDSANSVALNAFRKAISLENKEKGTYTKMSKEALESLFANSLNEGLIEYEKKNIVKAKKNFEVASGAKPSDTTAVNNVLVTCQQLKDTLCIINSYKKMIDNGKEKAEYYYWSYAYYQKRDTIIANKMMEDGIVKFPNNKIFVQNYIEELFAARKYAKVKDRLAQFVKDDPSNKTAKLKLAVTYEALGDLDNAEIQYKDVLAIEPTNKMALFNVGVILRNKALAAASKKDELKPEERATKGKELDDKYKKTLYESAKYFEEYRKIRPNDDQVKTVLIDIYRRLKRDDMIELIK